MRLRPVKLVKTRFSIATNVESQLKKATIVNGFSEVLNKLPMEFAEAQKLLEISLEGSVG
jgi:hypothetical protein